MPDRRRHRSRRSSDTHLWVQLVQTFVAAAALAFFAVHLSDGDHAATVATGHGIDVDDGSAVLGVGLALKLAYQLVTKGFQL